MDGLEAVEIKLSEIGASARIDAEGFSKTFLVDNKIINSLPNTMTLSTLCAKITQGSNPTFVEKGLSCLNGKNVYWGKITPNECNFVTETEFSRLSSFKLQKDDIVITLKHASKIGRAWIVNDNEPKIFGRNIGLIRLKRNSPILPTSLLFYLWTTLVQTVIDSMATGGTNGQITLPISALKQLRVPEFSKEFQHTIKDAYDAACGNIVQSETLYSSAETLLLSELGLAEYTPTNEAVSVKTFANSFGISGRLDAEYYHPKYDEIEQAINCTDTIQTACKLFDSNFVPVGKQTYKYIELSNVGSNGEIIDVDVHMGQELPTRARRLVKRGQVIVSSIEGSLDSCALVSDEYDNAICSTGFYVINSEKINPETLLMLFKSMPVQQIMKKRCSGTILTAINKDDFLKMPLPYVDNSIQTQIAEKIQQSFDLRKKSAALLEKAKQAVEMAIEQGEDTAIQFINDTDLLGE